MTIFKNENNFINIATKQLTYFEKKYNKIFIQKNFVSTYHTNITGML